MRSEKKTWGTSCTNTIRLKRY